METYSNDFEVKNAIKDNIEKYGCHISLIKSDGYNPSFAYTIGLTKTYNHPEVIVLGLDTDSAHSILSLVLLDIKEGIKFITGVKYNGFLQNHKIQFVNVLREHYHDYLGYAGWFNDNSWNFETIQLIWPDNNTYFPWDSNFSEKLIFTQPLLDRNTEFKFLEPRNRLVYITKDVLNGAKVSIVFHDKNGDWKFYSEENPSSDFIRTINIEDLIKLDLTLNNIYYLNYGESAFRDSKSNDWIIDSSSIRKNISNSLK